MESDLEHHQTHNQDQHQQYHPQKLLNSGLTRYQSAPSSYFSSLLDPGFPQDFLNRPSSPETESIFAKFLANNANTTSHPNVYNMNQDTPVKEPSSLVNQPEQQIMASMDDSRLHHRHQQSNTYSSSSVRNFYQDQSRPQLPDQNFSMATKTGGGSGGGFGNNSNLARHSSSPAELFSNMNIEFENGYAVLRETSTSRPPPSSSAQMNPIAEIGNNSMGKNCLNNNDFGDGRSNNFTSGFSVGSWDDSDITGVGDDNNSLPRLHEFEVQNLEATNRPPMLAHHLSLQKSSAEMSAIEKYLEFQDSVPCKIRAKRGCATHPRSIAERVRRTKISERMRKLQDLVPHMDKQTNTADMLELAVDYIKGLQRQVQGLSENREKCVCASNRDG
ncbi:hypothetical protein K2173_016311 [Erythroxylum novogranatense]|uniref:BHLH domain-containing protein n=1 Tax=Erythroxylum novogranatense TaxID=1862640 RepID=A0AAV8SGH3_9ROSI|nr:hypothetical protein K2173_016311 [Erythroxylum novogranatense]